MAPTGRYENLVRISGMDDGASPSIGATTDTAATTDTGNFSLIALFKRLLQKWTAGIGINSVTVGALAYQKAAGVQLTLVANTNQAAAVNIPAGTVMIEIYCATSDVLVAIGEAAVNGAVSVGRWIPMASSYTFPVSAADVAAGKAVNALSVPGGVVQITYLAQ